MLPAALPSPTVGAIHLGPLAIRGYALSILAGIVVAVWLTGRRLEHRGAERTAALDISTWAVPFGIVGGRIYHVVTSPEAYFGEGGHPIDALKIWQGGLGIWGAIAVGALGAAIGARRAGVRFADLADAAAPGVLLAHALGRWGNWFNNELYGGPTDLPWGLTIHRWDLEAGRAVTDAQGHAVVLGTFQPVFLYESFFCVLLDRPDLCLRSAAVGPRPALRAVCRRLSHRQASPGEDAHRRSDDDSGSTPQRVDVSPRLRPRHCVLCPSGPTGPFKIARRITE